MPQQLLDPTDLAGARPPQTSQPHTLPPAVRQFGYVPDFDEWRAGDLVLFSTTSPNLFQRHIVKTQIKLNYTEEDARWHHAAVYIGDTYLCEARPGGVRYHPVVETLDGATSLRLRRDPNLAQDQRFLLAIKALLRLSRPYSYASVFRAFLRPFNPRRFVRFLLPRGRTLICSQLFHDAYIEATGSVLVERADIDPTPAALSATTRLDDVSLHWRCLE